MIARTNAGPPADDPRTIRTRQALARCGFTLDSRGVARRCRSGEPEIEIELFHGSGDLAAVSAPFVPASRRAGSRSPNDRPLPAFFDAAVAPSGPFTLIADSSFPDGVRLVGWHQGDALGPKRTRSLREDFDLRELRSQPSKESEEIATWLDEFVGAFVELDAPHGASDPRGTRTVVESPTTAPSLDHLQTVAEQHGYEVVRIADEVRVVLESRHYRKQLHVEPLGDGVRLRVPWIETREWSPHALESAIAVTATAFPSPGSSSTARSVFAPARIVGDADDPARPIIAEAHLGPRGPESPFFARAIAALDAVTRSLYESVAALADEEVAATLPRCDRRFFPTQPVRTSTPLPKGGGS